MSLPPKSFPSRGSSRVSCTGRWESPDLKRMRPQKLLRVLAQMPILGFDSSFQGPPETRIICDALGSFSCPIVQLARLGDASVCIALLAGIFASLYHTDAATTGAVEKEAVCGVAAGCKSPASLLLFQTVSPKAVLHILRCLLRAWSLRSHCVCFLKKWAVFHLQNPLLRWLFIYFFFEGSVPRIQCLGKPLDMDHLEVRGEGMKPRWPKDQWGQLRVTSVSSRNWSVSFLFLPLPPSFSARNILMPPSTCNLGTPALDQFCRYPFGFPSIQR